MWSSYICNEFNFKVTFESNPNYSKRYFAGFWWSYVTSKLTTSCLNLIMSNLSFFTNLTHNLAMWLLDICVNVFSEYNHWMWLDGNCTDNTHIFNRCMCEWKCLLKISKFGILLVANATHCNTCIFAHWWPSCFVNIGISISSFVDTFLRSLLKKHYKETVNGSALNLP